MMLLRPFEHTDAATILHFIRDKHTFNLWSAGRYPHYPITVTDMQTLYTSIPSLSAFTAMDNGEVVGHITMRYPTESTETVRFGFILLDPDKRGYGYGKQMLSLAIDHVKAHTEASVITLGVFEQNHPARRCYEAVGFYNTGETVLYKIDSEEWRCLEYRYTL